MLEKQVGNIETVLRTDKYILRHHTGKTKYNGCQCFGNCGCGDSFKPISYDYYTVKRVGKSKKTTNHNTLEEAQIRMNFLDTL